MSRLEEIYTDYINSDEYVYGKELSPEDREAEDTVYKLMDMIFAENEEVYHVFEDANLAFLLAREKKGFYAGFKYAMELARECFK